MTVIDRALIVRFVEMASNRLAGDWVVMGGAVLPFLGIEHRTTLDIDVAWTKDATSDQMLVLMEIAEQLGLPVEAVNQSGAFFLHRIENWKDNLVVLRKGRQATIFRPDITLFVLLKIGRFTESDMTDCLEFIKHTRGYGEHPDLPRLRRAIRDLERKNDTSPGKRERLGILLDAL